MRPTETIAAIDCGTNTVLLTIARIEGNGIAVVEEQAEITRLGEGLAATGALAQAGIDRTLATFERYAGIIERHQCIRILAVGTEALRRATNGRDVVTKIDEVLDGVGAKLEIIGGEREAALSFGAVRGAFPELHGTRTVVDIGGGSTELIVGDEQIETAISIPIGSVVLTERYIAHDPPTAEERAALIAAIDEALQEAPPLRGPVVGIAGTVTTYAAIALQLADYDATRVHGHRLSRAAIEHEVQRLGTLPLSDRKRTPGLAPKRADVIYAGGLILARVLAHARAGEVIVSDRGVRWGLLYEAADR